MFISTIHIRNYRCFRDTTVEFQPGLNVIIGENNSGKTTLLKALSLLFDRRGRSRPSVHDFHRLLESLDQPPSITVSVTLGSSENDTEADRALVATWLTKLDEPWEAQLTYSFFLPEQHSSEFATALGGDASREKFFEIVEEFLPKFVSKVYAGNPATQLTADSESLARFDCQFLDALRDVETEMFSGKTPLFRSMLEEVLDLGKEADEKRGLRDQFRTKSNSLREELVARLDTERLFDLANVTGASDGGNPQLHGGVEENDLISALRLFIAREQFAFPATHHGLGYNNLIYISLMLASLSFRASEERRGQNAALFPMLLVEEPEAHLHPALQHKLLSHIVSRVQSEPRHNRQVFITTHSTHVTSAARLSPIIVLSLKDDGGIGVSYPARLFPDTDEGKASRGYVERYLDATKSTMLFAKATILVEGIAELLIVPALASIHGSPLDQHHVAVVRVDGVTFKHFLPLFGGGVSPEVKMHSLDRKVACIVDADPAHKQKEGDSPRWKSCFPFQINSDTARFDYRPASGVISTLQALKAGCDNIEVFHGVKTLEYDLALANHTNSDLVTDVMTHAAQVRSLASAPGGPLSDVLSGVLQADEAGSLAELTDAEKRLHTFAAIYLRCAEGCKGEHSFALEQVLRLQPPSPQSVVCPEYIQKAIAWVTPTAVAQEEDTAS